MDVKRAWGLTGADDKKAAAKKNGVYISDGNGGYVHMDDYMNDMKSMEMDEFLKKYPLEGVEIPGDPNYAKNNSGSKAKLSKEQIDSLQRLINAIEGLQTPTADKKPVEKSKATNIQNNDTYKPKVRTPPQTERDKQLEKERALHQQNMAAKKNK